MCITVDVIRSNLNEGIIRRRVQGNIYTCPPHVYWGAGVVCVYWRPGVVCVYWRLGGSVCTGGQG